MPNLIENQLRHWIGTMRRARYGNNTGYRFYPEFVTMAAEAGLPDLFDQLTLEDKSNTKTRKVCAFSKEHGIIPNRLASSEEERNLGSWLYARRYSKQGKGESSNIT